MDSKKRKRCSERILNISKKKSEKSCVDNEDVQQRRCQDWIQKQIPPKKVRKTMIDKLPSNDYDKAPPVASAESLASLKYITKEELALCVCYICEWKNCMKEFSSGDELHTHVQEHIKTLNPIRKKYYCFWDLCHFQTDNGDEVCRHIFYHAYHTILKTVGESLFQKIDIPRCTNDSTNRNLIPDLKEDFLCRWNECEKTFKSIYLFQQHVQNHISVDHTFVKSMKPKIALNCKWDWCEKPFAVAYRLSEHVKKHIHGRVVGCYHCGAIFWNKTNFFDHCKRQENSQEYQCAQCWKYFASERLLRNHVLVHVNSHKCPICSMTCNSAYQLAKHTRYRHMLVRPYQCSLCPKKFVIDGDLNTHFMSVHKKKPMACNEDGCKFLAKSLHFLRRHEAEVHRTAIYACHCCEKKYKHGRELSKHLKREHSYELLPGHRRFIYRVDESGFYRLQTLRIESLEVTEQISSPQIVQRNFEGVIYTIREVEETTADIKTPFRVIATHDSALDNLELPNVKFEKNNGDIMPNDDVVITFNEIDTDGNVIDSNIGSGMETKFEN